jgi:hypothetical protein
MIKENWICEGHEKIILPCHQNWKNCGNKLKLPQGKIIIILEHEPYRYVYSIYPKKDVVMCLEIEQNLSYTN